jgi:phosphatidylinositol alpha-1,6-mannosyltransferase
MLLLSSEFPPGPGGIGTHAYHVALHLQRLGWEVLVITRQDHLAEEEAQRFNTMQPFAVTRLRPISSLPGEVLNRARAVASAVRRWQPDVVLASGQRMVWLAAAILPLYRQPFVAVGHGKEFSTHSAHEHALTRWAFGRADQVICVSRYTWQTMLAIGVKPRGGCVIPNGADDQRFAVTAGDSPQRRELRLLTVGNVTERKGQDIVIRSLPSILRQYPNVVYEMIGLPTLRGRLEQLASELGVERHVRFSGYVDQETLARSLNTGDLFVMTSRHTATGDFEGYGIAVVEAALCGKPAVVANNSGLAEAVIDGETGFVVPENDPQATADAILTLLGDDSLRMRMGQAARARALREQTWRQRTAQYHEVLSQFVKAGH